MRIQKSKMDKMDVIIFFKSGANVALQSMSNKETFKLIVDLKRGNKSIKLDALDEEIYVFPENIEFIKVKKCQEAESDGEGMGQKVL